jgi:hypothetical protein
MHNPSTWYHASAPNTWYHALGSHPAGLPAWFPLLIAAILVMVALVVARRRVPSH